eukprot:PITA_18208
MKVMHYKSAKDIWDKIVTSYEGDEQVKHAKLQTLRIQYETLKMYNDESVANYFLRVDEVVNCMKNFGEEIKEAIVVEKLHGILTAYEMRKGGPSDRREAAFKASGKGDYYEASHVPEEQEEESNFVRNLQRGSGRFRGKLPFKCFACGRVGHYAAKCPYKDKRKEPARWNKKQSANDDYMDAIDVDYFHEEITKLKRCIEEKNMIIDTLQFQIDEKERHLEKLEGEIVGLRKEIEKTKAINLKFVKGSETLDEIMNVQQSPLNNTSLGYNGETSQASTSKSYLDAARRNEQKHNEDHQVKQGRIANRNYQGQSILRVNKSYNQPQVKYSQFGSRIDDKRNYNQLAGRFDNRRSFFNGQCFSCHNFGHKAAQCVAYKTIMTKKAQKQRSMTGITKRTYNNFSVLENEVECSICNNFGHEDS